MTGVVLVLNAGSSSIKFSLFEPGDGSAGPALVYRGEVEGIGVRPHFSAMDAHGGRLVEQDVPAPPGTSGHDAALNTLLAWIDDHAGGATIIAAGHRVVHGGMRHTSPVLVDPRVLDDLEALVPLAPLHQPHNLAAIRTLGSSRPDLRQVACFDTAFHATQPDIARVFALPYALSEGGIKRYGFHGLSYESIAHELPRFLGADADGRIVVAHLGAGASMCALRARRSVATTMSFTALDGLPMGTRTGALDPGVILHLIGERRMDLPALTDLLYRQSGLLGMSGISSDLRDLLRSDSPRAQHAIDVFVYRIGRELGSLAAALGGLDALVFTGGIGEHAAPIRARVCRDAEWLGIRLDATANAKGGPRISAPDSRIPVLVVPTDEELVIARHTCGLVRRQEG